VTLGVARPAVKGALQTRGGASERALFHAYGGIGRLVDEPVIEPCACGSKIVAISKREADVAQAVAAHNLMREHQAWRAAMEVA
jgi:hypothetical protein